MAVEVSSVQQMLAGEDSSNNAVLAVEDGSVQWWQVGDDGSVLSRLAGGDSSVQTQGCGGGSNDVGMICERSEEGAAGKIGRAWGTMDGSGGYGTAGWGGYRGCVEYISYPKDAEEAVTMEKNVVEEETTMGAVATEVTTVINATELTGAVTPLTENCNMMGAATVLQLVAAEPRQRLQMEAAL